MSNGREELESAESLIIVCPACGAAMLDDLLCSEQQVKLTCPKCGESAKLPLAELDRIADGLTFTIAEFKARNMMNREKANGKVYPNDAEKVSRVC